jgi:hypothetical protein
MIRIGTSSWADPEFVRDWYPPKLPAPARLGWYAQHFDYVEVNSTFYAIPVKKVVNRWDSETPSNFLFDVKLHGLLSRHAVKAMSLPPDIRRYAKTNNRGNLILTAELVAYCRQRTPAEVELRRKALALPPPTQPLSPRKNKSTNSKVKSSGRRRLTEKRPVVMQSGINEQCRRQSRAILSKGMRHPQERIKKGEHSCAPDHSNHAIQETPVLADAH